jgi:hypothetical protein
VLFDFAQWCEQSGFGTAIRESPWAFAVIESIHLLGLAAMGGAVLLVDLRLLGTGLRRQPVAALARDAWRWQNVSMAIMLVTGLGLYFSEAVKCYYSTPFWVKMSALVLAILFAFTVRRAVIFAPDGRYGRATQGLVALVSLSLWLAVGASGRWIGFSG